MADKETAFSNATGFLMSDLSVVIVGAVGIALFSWSAWVSFSHYRQWQRNEGGVTLDDVFSSMIRSALLVMLVLLILN
ncbi:MAG: TIGR03758 family integrating conjugative element protein [Gammaproteobacteria bacterium]|nr:TIGR03758 family integrating conjugative element protein [Gammaproteobacteria bacterium]